MLVGGGGCEGCGGGGVVGYYIDGERWVYVSEFGLTEERREDE